MERYPNETDSDSTDEIEEENPPEVEHDDEPSPEKARLNSWIFWGASFGIELLVSCWLLLLTEWFRNFRGGFQVWSVETNALRINSHGIWAAITFIVLPVHELLFGFVGDSLRFGVKVIVKVSIRILGLATFVLTFWPIVVSDNKMLGIHAIIGITGILVYIWDFILYLWSIKLTTRGRPEEIEWIIGYSQPVFITMAHGSALTGYGAMFLWAKTSGHKVDEDSLEFYLFQGLVLVQLVLGGACIALTVKRHYMEHHWDLITQKEIQNEFCSVLDKVYPKFRSISL